MRGRGRGSFCQVDVELAVLGLALALLSEEGPEARDNSKLVWMGKEKICCTID